MKPEYRTNVLDSEELKHLEENNEDTEDLFDMKMEDIKTFIHNVRLNIGKIQHIQSVLAAQKSKVSLEGHLVNIFFTLFSGYTSS